MTLMLRTLVLVLLILPTNALGQDSNSQTNAALTEYIALDTARLRGSYQTTLMELYEPAGDFGGYASPVFDLIQDFAPEEISEAALQAIYRETLIAALDEKVAMANDFWASPLGERLRWSERLAAAETSERGYARSGREIAERTSAERLATLQALDVAILDTQIATEVANVLLGLVEATAVQVSAATGEPTEWAESPEDIRRWIGGQYRDDLFRRMLYRLNRLEDVELNEYLNLARSENGRVWADARRSAHLAVAHHIVEILLPEQSSRLADELWEYRREKDEEDESGES